MQAHKTEFIQFVLETGVLRFGKFVLKSGRNSPYFFNTGLFNDGGSLARLGSYYAQAIVDLDIEFDVLFGPAYKGIPLATATAIALAEQHQRSVAYAFNRKEVKDHAEGGIVVGAKLTGRVLIIDDVISAGLSVDESVALISASGAQASGVLVALDRQERASASKQMASASVSARFQMPVHAIITLADLTEFLTDNAEHGHHLEAVRAYQDEYRGAPN